MTVSMTEVLCTSTQENVNYRDLPELPLGQLDLSEEHVSFQNVTKCTTKLLVEVSRHRVISLCGPLVDAFSSQPLLFVFAIVRISR